MRGAAGAPHADDKRLQVDEEGQRCLDLLLLFRREVLLASKEEIPDRTAAADQREHDDADQPPLDEWAATARLVEIERRCLVDVGHRSKFRFPSRLRLWRSGHTLQQLVDFGLAAAQGGRQLALRRALVDDLIGALLAAYLHELLPLPRARRFEPTDFVLLSRHDFLDLADKAEIRHGRHR